MKSQKCLELKHSRDVDRQVCKRSRRAQQPRRRYSNSLVFVAEKSHAHKHNNTLGLMEMGKLPRVVTCTAAEFFSTAASCHQIGAS